MIAARTPPLRFRLGGLAIRDDRGTNPAAALSAGRPGDQDDRGTNPAAAHPAAPARRGCARAAGQGQPEAPLRTANASPFLLALWNLLCSTGEGKRGMLMHVLIVKR